MENQELDDFIQDWHWDEKSHKYAQNFGWYLFQFIDHLSQQRLSEKTVKKHTSNCWFIGILDCQYGYKDEFSPDVVFRSPEAWYEYEFKRKMSDSKYATNSYRSTWRKLQKIHQGVRAFRRSVTWFITHQAFGCFALTQKQCKPPKPPGLQALVKV